MKLSARRSYSISSVQRCLQLLRMFGQAPSGLTAAEVGKLSGLLISTVYRFLANLETAGFLTFSEVGTLKLGSGSPQDSTDPDTGISHFTNPDALSQTPDNTFGTAARTPGSVRQPGARDVSMSLFKDFPMGMVREGMRLQFRAESFNMFNHPHFAGPNANVGASDYGFISSTLGSPRELPLALKLYF